MSFKKLYNVFNLSFFNCSEYKERVWEVYLGDFLIIKCDIKQQGMIKVWVILNNERVLGEVVNSIVIVFKDGSFYFEYVQVEDGGVYICYVMGEVFNEILFVELKVYNFISYGYYDIFNIVYIILVGCIFSVVLVFIYLYFIFCRCWCRGVEKFFSY